MRLAVAAAVLGGLLVFLLAVASANTSLFAQNYPLLLGLNALAAVALLGVVGFQLRRLWRDWHAGVFGSRIKSRLVVMLALMAVLPGAVIYAVSMQFAVKSIESWFDVRVDSALEGGLDLGRSVLDSQQAELLEKARSMALGLEGTGPASPTLLNRLREQAGVHGATLLSAPGRALASSSGELGSLLPAMPSSMQIRQARQGRGLSWVEGDADTGLVVRALVPVAVGFALDAEPRLLQLAQPVPPAIAKSAASVEEAHREYQELQLGRAGLKQIYTLTLTFTLLLALFAAVSLAFFLAERLARPLLILAEGTQAVAAGDFTPRTTLETNDELGVLTRSFNAMTLQLDQARNEREAAQRAAAWAEVAQRIAHEIKNPLTPIQLSAERLQMKLAEKLGPEDRAMLDRSIGTIVGQVEAMKRMVNDFRDYARLPSAVLSPLDLNALVREVLDLYAGGAARIDITLAEGLPPVAADASQLRQVLHNLIKNAGESLAENPPPEGQAPAVAVGTRAAEGGVCLVVADNGPGFPPQILNRAFEPYATTKARGTGLGLAIVKKIVDDHRGEVRLSNRTPGGAEVAIRLPAASQAN